MQINFLDYLDTLDCDNFWTTKRLLTVRVSVLWAAYCSFRHQIKPAQLMKMKGWETDFISFGIQSKPLLVVSDQMAFKA